jgi:hypothetical protein
VQNVQTPSLSWQGRDAKNAFVLALMWGLCGQPLLELSVTQPLTDHTYIMGNNDADTATWARPFVSESLPSLSQRDCCIGAMEVLCLMTRCGGS